MTANWIERLERDEHGRRILEQERLIVEVTESIATLLKEQEVSRAELARRIGTSQAFVTKLLRGDNNFTLRTLSEVFFALDRSVHLSPGEIGEDASVHTNRASKPLRISSVGWGRSRGEWAGREQDVHHVTRSGEGIAA